MDPEIKQIGNERKMARMRLATNNYYTNDKGERMERTDWHTVVAFGKVVDIIEKYVKKGQEIAIEGRLTSNNWEDKDGNKRQSVEVHLNELVLLQKTAYLGENEDGRQKTGLKPDFRLRSPDSGIN